MVKAGISAKVVCEQRLRGEGGRHTDVWEMRSRQREEQCRGLGVGDGADEEQGDREEGRNPWGAVGDTITEFILHSKNIR